MSKLIIDDAISAAVMRQFASQRFATLKPVTNAFKGMYKGDKSDEFYRGLLAGLTTAHVMNTNGLQEQVPHLMAFLAGEMEKKEIT